MAKFEVGDLVVVRWDNCVCQIQSAPMVYNGITYYWARYIIDDIERPVLENDLEELNVEKS